MTSIIDSLLDEFEQVLGALEKGGPGSGFHGHAGRPGLRGGSRAEDISSSGEVSDLANKVEAAMNEMTGAHIPIEGALKVPTARTWLTPNGMAYWPLGNTHESTAKKILSELTGHEVGYEEAAQTLYEEGFSRFGWFKNSMYYLGRRQLSFGAAQFIARILDADPQRSVTIEFPDEPKVSGDHRRILSRMVDDAYERANKEREWWLEKGGPGSGFHGHAGRPGQRGGSAHQRGSSRGPDTERNDETLLAGSVADREGIPLTPPNPRSNIGKWEIDSLVHAIDENLSSSLMTAELGDDGSVADALVNQYGFPADSLWALNIQEESDLLYKYMLADENPAVRKALDSTAMWSEKVPQSGALLGAEGRVGEDGLLGEVVSIDPKYAMTKDEPLASLHPELVGSPSFEKFFSENPGGGLVYSVARHINVPKHGEMMPTGQKYVKNYYLAVKNVLERKEGSMWAEHRWRISAITENGKPTGHVSSDFFDVLQHRLERQLVDNPGADSWQFEGAVANAHGEMMKEFGAGGLWALAQFPTIGNLYKGGKGSGHRQHRGRPELRGGSLPRGAVVLPNGRVIEPVEDTLNFDNLSYDQQADERLRRFHLAGAISEDLYDDVFGPVHRVRYDLNNRQDMASFRKDLTENLGLTDDQVEEVVATLGTASISGQYLSETDRLTNMRTVLRAAAVVTLDLPKEGLVYRSGTIDKAYKSIPKTVAEKMREFERAFGKDPVETAWIVGSRGAKLIEHSDHSRDSVNLARFDIPEHSWLLHNHPSSSPFSLDDIALMLWNGMSGGSVASTKNRYTIRFPKSLDLDARKHLLFLISSVDRSQTMRFRDYIDLGRSQRAYDIANDWHHEFFWDSVAKMFPDYVQYRPQARSDG